MSVCCGGRQINEATDLCCDDGAEKKVLEGIILEKGADIRCCGVQLYNRTFAAFHSMLLPSNSEAVGLKG